MKRKTTSKSKLNQDLPEEFRDIPSHELAASQPDTTANWSQAEDRSEDLINERDPFTQQPERNTQIPPELIQERAYRLYEERGKNPDGNLADWFDAEREIRQEIGKNNPKK